MTDINRIIVEYNKGTAYVQKDAWKKAEPILRKVIKQYPCKEAYTNIGNCYRAMNRKEDAYKAYSSVFKDNVPWLDTTSETDLHALNNLGLWHYMYGDDAKALEYYEKAIKKSPEFWEAWWNASTTILRRASSGELDQFYKGWECYKARFLKKDSIKVKNRKEGLIYWDGLPARDKKFITLTEQGIGDNLMFGRYLPILADKFDKVYTQCDPKLQEVFSSYNPTGDAIDTDAELAYPICSLGEFVTNVPPANWLEEKFSYLKHDFGGGFNVGIVWAGSSSHANDKYRSIDKRRFHSLAKHCNLYSLSPGFVGDKFIKSLDINSWLDTIAYINGLDLVISIDTSVVHMAGALGKEFWLLQPWRETDFRWGVVPNTTFKSGMASVTEGCVWYPNCRIFQNPQSWEAVFKKVEDELVKRIAS